MMYSLLLLALTAAVTASPFYWDKRQIMNITAPDGEIIFFCNGAPYRKSAYNCFAGQLCPIVDGTDYLACRTTCYDPFKYDCFDGDLLEMFGDSLPGDASTTAAACDPGLATTSSPAVAGSMPTGTGTSNMMTAAPTGAVAPNVSNDA